MWKRKEGKKVREGRYRKRDERGSKSLLATEIPSREREREKGRNIERGKERDREREGE